MDIDRYLASLREDIVFTETLRDQRLTFHSTWGIFSPREIDSGTRLLLDYLEIKEADDCFDLGCGYGPLGVTMAKLAVLAVFIAFGTWITLHRPDWQVVFTGDPLPKGYGGVFVAMVHSSENSVVAWKISDYVVANPAGR